MIEELKDEVNKRDEAEEGLSSNTICMVTLPTCYGAFVMGDLLLGKPPVARCPMQLDSRSCPPSGPPEPPDMRGS